MHEPLMDNVELLSTTSSYKKRLVRGISGIFILVQPTIFPVPYKPLENINMKFQLLVTLLPVVLPLVHGAPARRDTPNPGLRGSDSLVGYSPDNKGGSDSRPDIKYTLVPGQKEDPKIGAHLDFEKADNPQPIRGPTGADDPGPSTSAVILSRDLT